MHIDLLMCFLCLMCFLVAKKVSVAGTIMEPVILVPVTLETQGSFPLARYQPCVYEEGL